MKDNKENVVSSDLSVSAADVENDRIEGPRHETPHLNV